MLGGLPAGWAALKSISNSPDDNEAAVGAVDANGNAYCVWTEWHGDAGAERDMTFATNKSGSWSTPYGWPLDSTGIYAVGYPALAVTTDGAISVIAYHDGDVSSGLMTIKEREYLNGSWSAIKNISGLSDSCSYVTLSTNPVDNTIFAVWVADAGSGSGLKYKYRDPSTGQWSGAMQINAGAAGGPSFPNLYIDKNGAAHLVYIVRNGTASVWYTKNANPRDGSGWITPLSISADSGLNVTYPRVTADGDSNAYVVWHQVDKGVTSVLLLYMIDGAWGTTQNISNLPDLSEIAYCAVNGATHEMYIVWHTAFGYASGGTYNWDCCMKTYEINKATGQKEWSDIYRITSYPGHSGEPQIKITKEGDLHFFYFDNPVGDGQGVIFYSTKMAPRPAAVNAPTVASQLDRVLFSALKWNTITFVKNPDNDDAALQEYRLYGKKVEDPDTSYAILATFAPTDTLQYVHKNLAAGQRYAYMIGVVNKAGLELKSGATISN